MHFKDKIICNGENTQRLCNESLLIFLYLKKKPKQKLNQKNPYLIYREYNFAKNSDFSEVPVYLITEETQLVEGEVFCDGDESWSSPVLIFLRELCVACTDSF